MRCESCSTENPQGAKFCIQCATPFKRRCQKCAFENPPEARFCAQCATSLSGEAGQPSRATSSSTPSGIRVAVESSEPKAIDGERKTVTALFADIKGSMELMEDLDPEEARAIVDPALKLMIDAVHRYDGYIVQSTGDGIFALFGAPIAHEDHPHRALHAAFRMQAELKRYSDRIRSEGRLPIQVRVGVNTGEVVVRSIRTAEAHAEYTPIGHSISLGARMQALAPIGSIAATESVRKLCEGYFIFKNLGPTKVKGVSEPVEVYEVTGLGPLRTRLQRSAGRGFTKFVGRAREMDAMKHASDLAKAGHGQIVAAMAEAGVGKSRLFYEFKVTTQSGWMALEAFSLSHGKASAYLPVLELLRDYLRISADDDPRTRREKATGRVLALDRALEDTLPYLFALLGLTEGDDPLAQVDAQIRRRRMHEAIKRILLRESLNQPLILIFEDLHWIDSETQNLLNLLVDSIGTARVLLLVNYRPEYRHQWGSRTFYTQLRLDPLGRDSADEMLRSMLGEEPALDALKRLIVQRTEGNPFFMEETVQVLLDEGALVRNGGLKLTRPLGELKIPPTVQAILAARIDRLPPAEKDLLQTLAVIGKDFTLDLAKGVTGKTEEQLEPMLAGLRLGEFIYEQPTFGVAEYTFKHALTQEVAYSSVLAERRRATHERTARAIETLYAQQPEDHYGELARHHLLGDDAKKALRYAQLAAEQDLSRAAYSEATALVEAALKLLDKLPEDAERLRSELALRTIESTLAFVLQGASSHQRERAVRRMCELGEKIGERDQLLRGLITLDQLYFTQGESARGLEQGARCLELAETTRDIALLADVHWCVGLLSESCGELREAVSSYEEAMRHAHRADRGASLWGLVWRSGVTCHFAPALHLLGRVDEAARFAHEGLRRARESKHLHSLGHALTIAGGWMPRYRHEPEFARACAEETIALSEEHGFAEWLPWGRFHHGWALAELGQLKEGVAEMEAAVAEFRRLGGVPRQQFTVALLAQGYARTGLADEALKTLDEALAHVERSGEKVDLAEMIRLRGELLLMRDGSATAQAERCFRDALAVARAQEARWWELRATASLARLLAKQGKRDEARAMLAKIYGWFTEGFDTGDLKDAKALLDELNA
jgi:class 3 adenylate cyclase/predicted ATPase